MNDIQGRLLNQIQLGSTVIGGKFHASLKVLEKKGHIKIVNREEKTSHIKEYKEIDYYGKHRAVEVKKQIKHVIYNVKLIKD